jgi:hypothetical protein
MNITINILEVASELAELDLMADFEGNKENYPNGIYEAIEGEDDMTGYTDEAQDFFNNRYEYWWDFLIIQNIGDND